MWGWHEHMGWGWMGLWWVVVAVLIAAVVWFALSSPRGEGRGAREESPEQTIKRRYARGEIDRATYERMLEDVRR